MSDAYFSDREFGARPITVQEITPSVWQGIVGAINSRIDAGAFGLDFPRRCEDGGSLVTGTDETTLAKRFEGRILILNGRCELSLRLEVATSLARTKPNLMLLPPRWLST